MARQKSTVPRRAGSDRIRKGQQKPSQEVEAKGSVPVVAIGASAGGLDPIRKFLESTPANSGLAFVVIQHLDPNSKSLLPELLAKVTEMRVQGADEGVALAPNNVYVIPPGVYLSIESGKLRCAPILSGIGPRIPIDVFLRSLADDRGNRAIGIVMSGTGTDGAQGLKALKEAGGLTLVQDPEEAAHDGMPRYAILAARPDHVLQVKDMAAVLLRFVAHDYVKAARATPPDDRGEPPLASVVEALKSSTGQDFGHYKTGTLQRRVTRRMALHGLESWADYLALLAENRAEAEALAKDLLIHVTEFFRDPEAFAYFADKVLPQLLIRHSGDVLRVWAPGCSTGEEAYSLGMLFLEKIASVKRHLKLQIFATDIDDEALLVARAGIYPETIQSNVSGDRLDRFFIRLDGGFKIANELRQSITFSRHDVLNDPPFSRLDLISCRNLFIYLQPEAQHRVLALFHYALRGDGVLFLGAGESVGALTNLFDPVDRNQRIYRRRGYGLPGGVGLPIATGGRRPFATGHIARLKTPLPSLSDLVDRRMLEVYAPAAVVTNRQLACLYFFGPTDRYLQIASGEPEQDVLSIARDGLRPKLRETIARALRCKRPVAAHGVRFKREGRSARVTIEVQRIGDARDDLVLVSFIDELPQPGDATRRTGGDAGDGAEAAQLEQELIATRRELNRSIRDLRRANEELNATNEEGMSLNEEFLSANEELETSKEELQSLNEELTTVNAQLLQSFEQQQQTSTDLANLLNSMSVATLFLDRRLNIKMFNPAMKALFSIVDKDIGRPIGDLLPRFADPQLLEDATAACAGQTPIEREIHAESGAWRLRTVAPYRTETGDVQGAVVTFADVSRLKHAEQDAATARAHAEAIVDTVCEPLVLLDPELKIISSNAAFQTAFDLSSEKIQGQDFRNLGHSLLGHPRMLEFLGHAMQQQSSIETVELEVGLPNDGGRFWRVNARRLHPASAERPMSLLALDDITVQRRVVQRQLQLIIDALPGAVLALDSQSRICLVNKAVELLFGYSVEELVGRQVEMLVPAALRSGHNQLLAGYRAQPVPRPMGVGLDIKGMAKDGEEIPLDIGLSPVPTAEGVLILAAIHDLRPQKQIQAKLSEAKTEADRANQAKSRFLAAASHDLRQPLQTIGLLLGVLGKRATDSEARAVLGRLDDTVAGMAELLDTLLDINQIESDGIKPAITDFPIANLLARNAEEFDELAAAKGLTLRVAPSSLMIHSDRRLLERMLRNLLSNAVKYTDHGKVLLGCRRRGDRVRIEVWDTGVGIAENLVQAVFDEFYRIDRSDSSKFGLGLGLYIVQRFAELLGYTVEVRSRPGKGTMFALVVPLAAAKVAPPAPESGALCPTILLVEDDQDQLQTLHALLELEGYRVAPVRKGEEALARIRGAAAVRPDVIVCDYNLPGGKNGLDIIQQIRSELGAQIPALIVTADKSIAARAALEASGLEHITKPTKAAKLVAAVDALIKTGMPEWVSNKKPSKLPPLSASATIDADVGIIDDEPGVREALQLMLEAAGHKVATYSSGEALLADPRRNRLRCVVADLGLPGMDGLGLQSRLRSEQIDVPIVFVTGSNDLPIAVEAMRSGAADFLQKPVRAADLVASVARALQDSAESANLRVEQEDVNGRLAALTERERQVVKRMLTGTATKNIAADLGISIRTAEHHRQSVMRKMAAKSLATLIRMVGRRAETL